MNRKQFLSTLSAAGLALALMPAGAALAQQQSISSKDFQALSGHVPTEAAPGKIEVVEFFWYGCPHCYAFDPTISAWSKRLPEDVVFRRVHVPFFNRPHQQMFYALQAIGREDDDTRNVIFDAIQKQRKPMQQLDEMKEVLAAAKVDPKAFENAYNSFGVKTQIQRANKLTTAYGIDGVPTLGINGRYTTSPSVAVFLCHCSRLTSLPSDPVKVTLFRSTEALGNADASTPPFEIRVLGRSTSM